MNIVNKYFLLKMHLETVLTCCRHLHGAGFIEPAYDVIAGDNSAKA